MAVRWKYHVVAISATVLLGASAQAAPQQSENCRAIPDPARRLACYDSRESNPAPAAAAPEESSVERTSRANTGSPVAIAPPAANANPNRSFSSQIVAVTRIPHGFYRLRLADGSEWATTVIGAHPKIGQSIHHRRTLIGTHYFDMEEGGPITVRPQHRD